MQIFIRSTANRICLFLLAAVLMIITCTSCSNEILYQGATNEELATALLEDNREDIDEAITALQQRRQQTNIKNLKNYQSFNRAQYFSEDFVAETLGRTLYHRLMKRFCDITFYTDGTIAFSSDGFLREYSGFYYSTTGKKDIGGDADWYETYKLEENFYFFDFGY